jgi:hypothetical protein
VVEMIKTVTMDCDDAIDYVRENVKVNDKLELSYNRVFTPGEVIAMETEEISGGPSCKLMVQISSNLGTTVDLDLEEIRDDLVELKHTPKDGEDTIIIIIERCETDI